ncbi:DEAD/DEAH box helicase [Geminicoccaceae bacterium 1502E]|nr:DEAD/DEAH box helicase [Geminicoccaceae bacterium 1502E]
MQHRPPARRGSSLGTGHVIASRLLAGFDQVLVQFAESGQSHWLDWRVLAQATPVEVRAAKRQSGQHSDHAERFRLRVLAKALRIWNANTGGFGRLDIDPLPHQLDVARRVVTSPHARWLIADDVGLGKTIEVGLILHALTQRNRCRRVLIICPSSLTKQWKDEMRAKFGRAFEIYHRDFRPEYADEMRLRDNVIASLDLAKRDEHVARLIEAGFWDVIVFDEAHRLGRSASGEQTERYVLARKLRDRTHSLLLLTATPHQGKRRRFAALLELVRPDLLPQIQTLEMNPEIVGDIILRNRKAKVTDADGRLIFRGHDTARIKLHPSPEMREADAALRRYLNEGYRASADAQDRSVGRAIGFVMTTYRKLASSSVAAIERALERRLERLATHALRPILTDPSDDEEEDVDLLSESTSIGDTGAFFEDEISEVHSVLALVRTAKRSDSKLRTFLHDVLAPLLTNGHNLLVFTEYRATQAYLVEAISRQFPAATIATIHGSMSLDEKTENVRSFNGRRARVMISTEAGGEGLNLQESCHIMVNYDLPWNPARLVQRIGRLYRYGQRRRVQVINLQSDDSFDSSALSLMLDRVSTIAEDMAAVAGEERDALAADILGELLSNIDMEAILERATTMRIEQTDSEIADAIRLAQEARAIEEDILQFASGHQTRIAGGFDARHMVSFVKGMAEFVPFKIRNILHDGKTLEIVLPEQDAGRWPEFGRRRVVRLTADHTRAVEDPSCIPMDFDNIFVGYLADLASDRLHFDGLYGEARVEACDDLVSVHHVRWQGISGEILEEDLIALISRDASVREMTHGDLSDLLLHPLGSVPPGAPSERDKSRVMAVQPAIDKLLARRSEYDKMPASVFAMAALRRVLL